MGTAATDAAELFRAFLGVLTTAQLLQAGVPRKALDAALAAGKVQRLRRGWIAWQPDAAVAAAVRGGGCISCVSAMGHLGAWQPRGCAGHVRRADGQRDKRARRSAATDAGAAAKHARPRTSAKGCRPYGANPPVTAAIDDLETAFRCALRCADREQIVTIADSIVHRGLASLAELRRWAASAPRAVRRHLDLVEPLAESGTESMVRVRLLALGLSVRVQQWIGRRRVDLMIGDRLIVECDSVAHHADLEAFQRDRRADRAHVAAGYLVIRLTWEQIHDEWPAIERDILAIVRRGDHRWRKRLGPNGGEARSA
ncbi:type IV toxin-antitoxin system AbiEi family antitoxin domain-containing protein [Agrococcus sp. HG114]|nr:type IV toxin-antitoxin system AbiEi family antitoxin domain-containing protein [Agrococcus sp. HG114]